MLSSQGFSKRSGGVYSPIDMRGRMGIGQGTRIVAITDGTSNTVLVSEVTGWHQPTGTSSSSPAGFNGDVRGSTLTPAAGNVFTGMYPPNSRGTDQVMSAATNIQLATLCTLKVVSSLS
jgi:hypothetical protein